MATSGTPARFIPPTPSISPTAAPALASQTRVYWKVRVWDTANQQSPFSENALWETTLLHPFDWQAHWITAYYRPVHAHRPGAAYLRKSFTLAKPIARARLYATARGIYVPYLNGKQVGEDLYRPGWTDYNKRIQYQTL